MDGEGPCLDSRSLAILVPVLRRPHRVAHLLASAKAATPSARVLFIASPGDEAEHDAVRAAGGDLLVIARPHGPGDYAAKINAGHRHTTEPLLFLGADDIDFHPGWFEAAVARMTGPAGVVGTNDLGNDRVMRGEHATHSLVSRFYADRGTIDEPGKVLHEGYPHEFVDDEFVATAKYRGAWAFASDAVVEHLHPLWGKAPTDDLYDAHAERMRLGRRVYQRRCRLWT